MLQKVSLFAAILQKKNDSAVWNKIIFEIVLARAKII